MIDLEKYKKNIEGWIEQWGNEDYPITSSELLEVINQAIVAEKAVELMAEYISISEMCHDCQFRVGKDDCDGFTGRRACDEVIADWFVEEAREQE